MAKPNGFHQGRKILFSILTIFMVLLILEGAGWAYVTVLRIRKPSLILDDHYGWITEPNVRSVRELPPYGIIEYSTVDGGFRLYGDVNTERTKILVVGDSYTQARTVTDGKTYYDYIEAHTDAEVFALGVGGFGSLQEYFVIDQYFDIIDPDIIVWQFCVNDLNNNSWELATRGQSRNHMTRPYYRDGEIRYLYPSDSWLVRLLLSRSHFLRIVSIRLGLLSTSTVPGDTLTVDHPLVRESIKTTTEILQLAKKRVGSTPIVSFSACGRPDLSFFQALKGAAEQADFLFTEAPGEAVKAAELAGVTVNGKPRNRHWNDAGHKVAGREIVDFIVELGLVERLVDDDGSP